MKSLMLMIAIALLVLVAPVFAQTGTLQATVPFNFTVRQRTLPAGEYQVIVEHTKLWLAPVNAAGIYSVFTRISAGTDQGMRPKLVFNRYGDRYFLSEVWTGNGHVGQELVISSTEREYARALKPESTVVLAKQVSN
jgi:hypothetical protein